MTPELVEARAGRGRSVLVAGPAGIGKTALLRAWAVRARAEGFAVLEGAASEMEAQRPFGAVVDILRAAVQAFEPPLVERIVRLKARELARLLPEFGPSPATAVEAESRLRVAQAFHLMLGDLSHRSPIAILIDDLHWVDEGTLELFLFCARRIASLRVLLVGAYRTDELHRLEPLQRFLADIERNRVARQVDLSAMTIEQTGEIILSALGSQHDVARNLRDEVHARAEGNPFVTEELLRTMSDDGAIVVDGPCWTLSRSAAPSIPGTVSAAVQRRLRSLSPTAAHATRAAALIGQSFGFELLQRVTGYDDDAVTVALRQAIDAQLIEERRQPAEEYRFRHALTREAVAADLLAQERRRLHRVIAEALEAATDPEHVIDELAHHFDEAGDQARAYRYHEAAATAAERKLAFAQSVRHLERALELATVAGAELAALQLRLAEALWRSSSYARGYRAAEIARDLYADLSDPIGEGRALMRMSNCASIGGMGEQDREIELVRQAVTVLERAGQSAELAEAHGMAGMSLCFSSFREQSPEQRAAVLSDARAHGEKGITMARRTSNLRALAAGLHTLGVVEIESGSRDGLRLLRECLKHVETLPDLANIVNNNLYVNLLRLGAAKPERDAAFEQWGEFNRRHGYRPENFLRSMLLRGIESSWDDILPVATELAGDDSLTARMAELHLSLIVTARAGPERGMRVLEDGIARLRAVQDPWRRSVEWPALRTWWIAGDDARILGEAEGALTAPPSSPLQPHTTRLYALAAAIRHGESQARATWMERATERAPSAGEMYAAAGLDAFARAERCIDAADQGGALEELATAVRVFVDDGWATSASVVRLRRIDLLLQRAGTADRDEAERELGEVLRFWSGVNATWYLTQLRKWAASRGLRAGRTRRAAHRQPSDARGGLTGRQFEVATLVAEGLTNKNIADKLGLRERTVDSHLEQIRRKLGLRNRSQLAVWATAQLAAAR